jgi:hypothetical protein
MRNKEQAYGKRFDLSGYYVKTYINNKDTGELIEKVTFIYPLSEDEELDGDIIHYQDLSEEMQCFLDKIIVSLRKYEEGPTDIYRTCLIRLEDSED